MKVAIAQIGTDPGAFRDNTKKIQRAIKAAKEAGAQIVIFPEGAVQGYAHMDLAFDRGFIKRTREALEVVAAETWGITVIIGFLDLGSDLPGPGGKPVLYNSAAVLQNGKILAIRDKTLLPEYQIFSEHRYFTPGTRTGLVEIEGKKVGIGICEDMWSAGYREQVYPRLIADGAEVLVNLSASPFHVGKQQERIQLIDEIIAGKPVAFVYCNLVGSYDGYDGEVVFDGQSMVWGQAGSLIALAPAFEEALLVSDLSAPPVKYKPAVAAEELYAALLMGIREYFRRSGFERALVGLSGGIDSALVASLCSAALGAANVKGVTMPSHVTSGETLSDARLLAKNLGIECIERSITAEFAVWKQEADTAHDGMLHSLTLQNKQARIRGAILMEYSNQDPGAIVVSTGNKTELALGYCTLYGDMCGGFAAISDVSKDRVYLLSRYVNELAGREVIPVSTLERAPTAELEAGQTDAANLPADYDIISPLVDAIVDGQESTATLDSRYDPAVVRQTLRLIRINEFKRRQAAPGIRVTRNAFGIGRRIPMAHGYLPERCE